MNYLLKQGVFRVLRIKELNSFLLSKSRYIDKTATSQSADIDSEKLILIFQGANLKRFEFMNCMLHKPNTFSTDFNVLYVGGW